MSSTTNMKNRAVGRDTDCDWRSVIDRLKSHVHANTVNKLFREDQQFIFELVKILYEDVIEFNVMMDILMIIEQDCSGFITKSSADQIVSALIDIFEIKQGNYQTIEIRGQLLITITTIFIEDEDLMELELCSNFISKLFGILRKTNVVSTRRLRAIVCNSLIQLEDWKPGVLWKWKDLLNKMARDERTDVCQDYVHLLMTVIKNSLEESHQDCENKEILTTVSYAMENISLLTGPGALNILFSVVKLVETRQEISPCVFKPFMLQCFPYTESCILFLMLSIQDKFRGEILSVVEEKVLLLKALGLANHAAVASRTRLITIQWLISYKQQHKLEPFLQEFHKFTHPTVFEPLNVHSCKLLLHCLCTPSVHDNVISQDLHYLTQLATTTGGVIVTRSLYCSLYSHVFHHNCHDVYTNALSITQKLFQKFPHLIPLIVDFLQTVKVIQSDKKFHIEILSLLHETVLSIPLSSILSNYQNFLQIWMLSAQDPSMNLQEQLRHMLELAKEAHTRASDDWVLGCLLLSICRTMMLHHNTDRFYPRMGELLFYMMNQYGDPDIQDYARFYYGLLIFTSSEKVKDILKADVVDDLKMGESLADFFPGSMVQVLPSDIHVLDVSPINCSRKRVLVEFNEMRQEVDNSDLKDYFEWYKSKQLHVKPFINCELAVVIRETSDLDDLIAVSFQITNQKQKDDLIEEIHVPFMSKKEVKDVSFQFLPQVPIPCALGLKSMFGHERVTFQCDHDPINMQLADFLVPFPWNVFSISENKQWHVFDSLWKFCTNSRDSKGVESVKIMPCNSNTLVKIWQDAQVIDAGMTPDSKCFLFLMVPSFHLLLHTHPGPGETVVEIASDFPPVLEYVDEYLDNLINV